MTCPTCNDKLWTIGLPYNDPDTESLNSRQWIIPCPDCSPNLTASQAAKIAALEVEVGWAMCFFVAGLSPTSEHEPQMRLVAWPFRREGEPDDNISCWMDREPTVAEMVTMEAYDQADEGGIDASKKLT